jgi:O-succinylbenzoic acid--CoA ligase
MRDLLADRVVATPDATALVRAADGATRTYAELDAAVDDVAGRLAALGLAPGDALGVCLPTTPAAAECVHAAMRLGVVIVPLGPRLTPGELAGNATRGDVAALVCDASTESQVRAAAGELDLPVARVGGRSAADGSDDGTPGAGDRDDGDSGITEAVEADESDEGEVGDRGDRRSRTVTAFSSVEPAAFDPYDWVKDESHLRLFTSGTTGTPKVVRITPRMVVASAIASAFRLGVTPGDRWYDPLSIHHTGGIAPLYRATLYGTAVVLRDGFDAATLLADLAAYDVTGVSLVPTMLRRVLDATDDPPEAGDGTDDQRATGPATGEGSTGGAVGLPDSLRTVLLGGAPASESLLRDCRERGVPVHPTYGTTETASQVATARPAEALDPAHFGTVGRPLLWTRVTVVDDGEPVPPGEPGELVVNGPTVTPGYYGDEAATAESFGEYGFHTGDVGRLDDGRLTVLGRLDDRILTGGENVDPGEVADVLRSHPGVREAAVVGLPDEEWGERVAALVVPAVGSDDESGERDGEPSSRSPSRPTIGELEAHCRERLAGYKRPRVWAFADELPRTTSGTVEREAVRRLLSAPRDR